MSGPSRALVGRDDEVAALEAALAQLQAGGGAAFAITGEAGLGKSRLLEELAARAESQDVDVIWGRCWEAGGAPAFWPFIEALRELLRLRDADALAHALGPRARHLAGLLPELGDEDETGSGGATPQEARFRLLDAAAGLLREAARERPFVLLLEDMHAADESSALLLDFVVRQTRDAPLLVASTWRPLEAQLAAVGASLEKAARSAERLALSPLGAADVARLLQDAGGDADATRVFERTDGNPLFVVELSRLPRRAAGVPAGVKAVLHERLAALSEPARAALAAAAVAGREVGLGVVAEVLGLDAGELSARFDEPARLSLVELGDNGRVRFSHALVREVLYDELAPDRRRALHVAIADVLERDDVGATSSIAHHLLRGGPSVGVRAAVSSRAAGDDAMRRLAYEEAAEAYEAGLAALDGAPSADERRESRAELLLRAGRAHAYAGDAKKGRGLCAEAAGIARARGSAELLANAALEAGAAFVFAAVDDELRVLLEEALDALPDAPSPLRARLLARYAAARQPELPPDEPMRIAREAIAMARETGDDAALLAVGKDAISALMDLGPPDERRQLNRAHLALARSARDRGEELRAQQRLMADELDLADLDAAERCARAVETLGSELGLARARRRAQAARVTLAAVRGREDEALAALAALERETGDDEDANTRNLVFLLRLGVERSLGRYEDALATIDRMPSCLRELSFGAAIDQLVRQATRARAGLDAAPVGEAALAWATQMGDPSSLACASELAEATGDAALARRVLEQLRPRAGGFLTWGMIGLAIDTPVDEAIARCEAVTSAPTEGESTSPVALSLRRDGELWRVESEAEIFHLKDSKGLGMLSRLLEQPGVELHALDLGGGGGPVDGGDAGELLDDEARAAYRERVAELRESLDEAEAMNDRGRAERAREELHAIEAELSRAVGLGGRARRAGANAERARVNVTRRLRDAIKRIAARDAKLGEHLTAAVRTGTYCCYEP
jgi:hypothetical protein